MAQADILERLKINLQIAGTAYDQRLTQIISAAENFIETEGIDLNLASEGDMQIVEMYAEWLWRRRDTGDGMPRMLRRIMNNRLFSQKMAVTND